MGTGLKAPLMFTYLSVRVCVYRLKLRGRISTGFGGHVYFCCWAEMQTDRLEERIKQTKMGCIDSFKEWLNVVSDLKIEILCCVDKFQNQGQKKAKQYNTMHRFHLVKVM